MAPVSALAKYKLVFLGDQSVGIDFLSNTRSNCPIVALDTTGQERFKSLIPSYIRYSSIASMFIDSQVSIEEGEAKACDLNVLSNETSAKAGFNIKALFRKIAAALPRMETLSSTKQEDMIDVNLKSSNAVAAQSQPQSGGCAC
ncbi:hypothetical protein ACJW31_11G132700 [Castanea mollissima]